jgi:hypothetical protein
MILNGSKSISGIYWIQLYPLIDQSMWFLLVGKNSDLLKASSFVQLESDIIHVTEVTLAPSNA